MHPYRLFALVLPATSCAKVGLPNGGPVDKEAPRILSHYPTADALEVARDEVVEIAFSEAMDRERTEEALFVSPAGPLQLKWRGTTGYRWCCAGHAPRGDEHTRPDAPPPRDPCGFSAESPWATAEAARLTAAEPEYPRVVQPT